MANLQTQQTRVLFLDGQAIILQNEPGDNAFGDLNAELLQQALQSVGVTQSVDDGGADTSVVADASYVVPTNAATAVEVAEALPPSLETGGTSNFRLIFQNDDESQGAVRFMTEDAEALGLKIFVDGNEVKQDCQQHEHHGDQTNGLTVTEEQEHHTQHEQQQVVFTTHSGEVAAVVPSYEGCQVKDEGGTTTQFQSAADALGALVGATTAGETVSVDHPVTLVPQLIDGCVSYAVQFANGEDESADVGSSDQQEAVVETPCSFSSAPEFAVSVTAAPETHQQPLQLPPVLSRIREHKSIPVMAKTQITSRPHVPARKISPQNTPGSGPNRIKVHVVGGKVVTEPEGQVAVRPTQNVTRIAANSFDSAKPLGSSENPIQLVQHGQTFHSVQALTQEQLKQIATVLQQQQLDSTSRTKNVVYDAETNTRIIYRVVYPEDLDLCEPNSPLTVDTHSRRIQGIGVSHSVQGNITLSKAILNNGRIQQITSVRGRGSGRRGRHPGSRTKRAAESPGLGEIRMIHDEAEEAARTERKKQLLSRTRSGRLSRPPRHMVKDYKRLHRLDFADADLDDSDGGYSDYQTSDHEDGKEGEGTGALALAKVDAVVPDPALAMGHPTVPVSKRKISPHFRCPGCQKVYLGHSRMARHLQAFPEHARTTIPDEATSPAGPADDGGGVQEKIAVGFSGVSAAVRTTAAATASTPAPVPTTALVPAVPNGAVPTVVRRVGAPPGPRKKGKRRGPWAYITPEAKSQRRKEKLREVLVTCEPVEVAEVCGRTVCGSLSLLELLWLRLEAVCANRLLEELAALVGEARTLLGSALTKDEAEDEMGSSPDEEHVEVCGDVLCLAMGLECGRYRVDSSKLRAPAPPEEPSPPNPASESIVVPGAFKNVPLALEVCDVFSGEPKDKKPRIEDLKMDTAATSPDSGSSSVGMDCSFAGTPSEAMIVDGDVHGKKEVLDLDTQELRLCPLEALGLQAQTKMLEAVRSPDSGVANPKEDSSPASAEAPRTPTELPHAVTEVPSTPAELPKMLVEVPHSAVKLQSTSAEAPGRPDELPPVMEMSLPHPQADIALPRPPPVLPIPCTQADLHHVPTEMSPAPPESPPIPRVVPPISAPHLHHGPPHPLDEDLLDGLCCSAEGHPDVAGSDEDAGRRAALQAVDDIVRERLGLVDFLDVIPPPPPPPTGRIELPGFASLQVPHRTASGGGIPAAPPPTFLSLPDLADHIDLDALGEELGTAGPPAPVTSGGEVVRS